ncbi:hypothetical protein ACFX2C_026701 [Malus domestica]
MITKGDTLLTVMAVMLVVAAKRALVLQGLVIRVPRLWLRYQVCYAGVNGHACGVQRCVCLIPRGKACPEIDMSGEDENISFCPEIDMSVDLAKY